jgi:hypothetical protein
MIIKLAAFLALAFSVTMVQAQPAPDQQTAKITESGGLFKEPKLDISALSECQPLKGETVAIQKIVRNMGGMTMLDLAKVSVLSGQCAGQMGWIGLSRLEAVNQ